MSCIYKTGGRRPLEEQQASSPRSHVQRLPATHLRSVSKPRRQSLVKPCIDYLLLQHFQRAAVLSAQMWVQLRSGAPKKNKHFPDPTLFFSCSQHKWKLCREKKKISSAKPHWRYKKVMFCLKCSEGERTCALNCLHS